MKIFVQKSGRIVALFGFLLLAAVPTQGQKMRPEEVYQSPEAAEYYASRPEFFRFAKPEDLPKDLVWENNADAPEFADPAAKRGGSVTIGMPGYPATFRRVGPNSNGFFRGYMYDNYAVPLTIQHPLNDQAAPGTALEWAISADRKTVYYKLDPNVRFTDGQPVTADDYLFTFYFYNSPYIVAPWYNDYYSREFAGITKFDDYTIAITLPDERSDPVYFTAIEPTPRQFFKDFGPDYITRYQTRFQPTTGAYSVAEEKTVTEMSVTLKRVGDWWGDGRRNFRYRYNPDWMVFRVIRDAEKLFQMFLVGDLDMMEIRVPKFWYQLNKQDVYQKGYVQKATFYFEQPCPTWGLFINTIKPLLDDRNIRLGIQYATDWQRVIDTFYRGDYQRLNQYTEGFGKFTNPDIKARPYDPDVAMEYFAKAGFTERGSDGILRNKEGERLSFVLTMSDRDERKFLPTLIDSARKAGLEFRPEALEATTRFKKLLEKKHDIAFSAWNVVTKYPRYWEGFHIDNAIEKQPDGTVKPKRQTNNITSTRDEELSKLIDECRLAKTDEDVIRLGYKIQQMIHDEASFVPAYKVVTYRMAYWRWIRFGEQFGMKNSTDYMETGMFWVDEDRKAESEAARREGKTFPPSTRVYDQFNTEK